MAESTGRTARAGHTMLAASIGTNLLLWDGESVMSKPDLRRAFLDWLDEARSRLAVAIHIERSTAEAIDFSFALANPVLLGALIARGDLVISAEWAGTSWDFLFFNEVRPQQNLNGFTCSLCKPGNKRRVFPSLETLWHDHLFEPFADWINTKLAIAQAVALYRSDNGSARWARLVTAGEDVELPYFLVKLAL